MGGKKSKIQIITVAAAAAVSIVSVYFLFFHETEGGSVESLAANPLPIKPSSVQKNGEKTLELSKSEVATTKQRGKIEANSAAGKSPGLAAQVPTVKNTDAVLDAISAIESWEKDSYSPADLAVYLGHSKLWVQLTAFSFAIKIDALEKDELQRWGKTMLEQHSHSQIRRFLERSRVKNPDLHSRLVASLFP